MDLITVDLTKFIKSRLTGNDYIELVNLKNNIDYLAKIIKTIPYEILTSLGKRYQRRYIS
jgi:alanine racemase